MKKKNKKGDILRLNLTKVIKQFICGQRYEPMTAKELFTTLSFTDEQLRVAQEVVKELRKEGEITLEKGKIIPKPGDRVRGIFHMHPRGFGFVTPEDAPDASQDIFIPPPCTKDAMEGDIVFVEVNPIPNKEKGPDGKIVGVDQRTHKKVAGVIEDQEGPLYFVFAPLLGPSKFIEAKSKKKYAVGDRVELKITSWGEYPEGEILEKIGKIDDPSCDVTAATKEFTLKSTFPTGVIAEAKKFGDEVRPEDLKGRTDCTKSTSITIDPETARDFDDALSLKVDEKGHYHLAVHIADVSHYVKAGSALDIEAFGRSNSTYFPGTCLPMLPEELSNNLCSLRPDVIRLTISVFMEFNPKGELLSSSISRAYIKSAKRFTYEEAKEVLDGKKKSGHSKLLKQMVDLCQKLKQRRFARGSVDLAIPETVIEVDKKGKPTGLKEVEYDITHQLVEEFMLKANEIVAKTLSERGVKLIFRVHEEPETENLEDFYATARFLGFTLPPKPTQADLQKLFASAKDSPLLKQLSIGYIRMMKMAIYSPENVGHFGLQLEYYCHFTSPIRRYSDLIVHRLLFEKEQDGERLRQISNQCSEKERLSMKAENHVKQLKQLRYLEMIAEKTPDATFTAIVTKVKPMGFAFSLKDLPAEGFLHVSELRNDYFTFNPNLNILSGRATNKHYHIGKELTVRLQSVDLILLESHWELSERSK